MEVAARSGDSNMSAPKIRIESWGNFAANASVRTPSAMLRLSLIHI